MRCAGLAAYPILTVALRIFAGKHPSSIKNLLADEVRRKYYIKYTKIVYEVTKKCYNIIIKYDLLLYKIHKNNEVEGRALDI